MSYIKLTLSDQNTWVINSQDNASENFLTELSSCLHLPVYDHQPNVDGHIYCTIYINSRDSDRSQSSFSERNGITTQTRLADTLQINNPCILGSDKNGTIVKQYWINSDANSLTRTRDFWQLTSHISLSSEERSGILLHSALIAKDKEGILFLGPSGIGKTTASLRIKTPWRCMSDDSTLVIKGRDGRYRVHPWPSWFHLFSQKAFTGWDIEKSFYLKSLNFIYQSVDDRRTPIGSGEATAHLLHAADHAGYFPPREITHKQQLRQLDYLSELARTVPSYRLDLSLDGEFWKLLE